MYIEKLDGEKIARARSRWPDLNDADFRDVGNESEKLVDLVSRRGGIDRGRAEREVDAFLESCGCSKRDRKSETPLPTGSGVGPPRLNNPAATEQKDQWLGSESPMQTASQGSGSKPGTSTDDQTGEMAAAGPGRKTRPEQRKP